MRSLGENGSINHLPTLKLLDFFLRVCVLPLSAASIWFTVTNQEENSSYGKLEFSNFKGLKYMVCISAISATYALVAAASSWIRSLVIKAWVFFVSDQIVAYLLVTSVAAASEIVYLVYKGDKEVSWSEACSSYGRFCSRLKLVLGLHFFSLCCFLVVAVISAYRVFSMFEPPSKESEEEERN